MKHSINIIAAMAAAALTAGCSTTPYMPTIDKTLLVKCEEPPPLKGTNGAQILRWARQAGPGISACVRNHNALVDAVKPLQRN